MCHLSFVRAITLSVIFFVLIVPSELLQAHEVGVNPLLARTETTPGRERAPGLEKKVNDITAELFRSVPGQLKKTTDVATTTSEITGAEEVNQDPARTADSKKKKNPNDTLAPASEVGVDISDTRAGGGFGSDITKALSVAKERKKLMRELAKTDPEAFLKNVIPTARKNELPDQIKNEIETFESVTGAIEILHIDDFEDESKSEFQYKLKSSSKKINLHLIGQAPPIYSGTTVTVSGVTSDDVMVAYTGASGIRVVSEVLPAAATGEKKILVIPITSPAVNSQMPIPAGELNQIIFNGPFQDYYSEQSYGKLKFSGQTVDWVSVPKATFGTQACNGIDLNTPAVKNRLIGRNINPANFDMVVFVIAKRNGGCAAVGSVEHTFNGVPIKLGMGWVGFDETVGKYVRQGATRYETTTVDEFAYTNCRAVANNNPKQTFKCYFNDKLIYDTTRADNSRRGMRYFSYVMAHEVGHILGVMHANALLCSGGSYYGCSHVEYGNRFDVMGPGMLSSDDIDALWGGHFNALYKRLLNWISPNDRLKITTSGAYSVTPLASNTPGPEFIYLENPALPQKPLFMEYRRPIGFDRGLKANQIGLYINEPQSRSYFGTSRLLGANQPAYNVFQRPQLLPRTRFVEEGRGITVEAREQEAGSAKFFVTYKAPVCKRSFSIEPTFEPYYGDVGHWGVGFKVVNADSLGCTASTFEVSVSVSNGTGWKTQMYPAPSVTIQPDTEEYMAAWVISPMNDTNPRTITVTAKDVANNRTQSFSYATQVTSAPELQPQIAGAHAETDKVTDSLYVIRQLLSNALNQIKNLLQANLQEAF